MKVVTLRKIPPELARRIRRRAEEEGTSASRTVIKLLEEGTGIRPQGTIKKGLSLHHDLDALAGAWTASEAEAFDRALSGQRQIEPDLWK
jgi:hypothetical protein